MAEQPTTTETPTPTQTPEPAPGQTKPSKGYGKRPVWQWVVIYLIVAIVVYGLIYLLFFHKGGSSGSGY